MTNLRLMLISIVIAFFLFVIQKQKQKVCNSPNSIAEKIDFGKNNCLKK
jgi:hypothetical protein